MPDRATIHRLARALPETQMTPLVVAYLQDLCPLEFRSKVVIRVKSKLGKTGFDISLKIDLEMLTGRQRALIREFMRIVAMEPQAVSFLEALLKFLDQDESSKGTST